MEVAVHERNSGKVVAHHRGRSDEPLHFTVSSPQLWSPDSPHLYNVTVRMGADHVRSYTGFRSISKAMIDGVVRPLVNGEFKFLFGPLDQGYWPDGLYTPPKWEAMVYDLKVLKKLGFNMVRKHVSVVVIGICGLVSDWIERSRLSLRYFIRHVMKWAF